MCQISFIETKISGQSLLVYTGLRGQRLLKTIQIVSYLVVREFHFIFVGTKTNKPEASMPVFLINYFDLGPFFYLTNITYL